MRSIIAVVVIVLAGHAAAGDLPTSRPETLNVPVEPWTDGPRWLKAPDGTSEFMPDPALLADGFTVGRRRLATTTIGWLAQQDDGSWRIMPEFFGRRVAPMSLVAGQFWVVEDKPLRTSEPPEKTLLAMDPTDWSVSRRIKLSATSQPVHIEPDGYWLLEGLGNSGGRPGFTGHKALARYSLDGKETFRYQPQPAPGYDGLIGVYVKLPPNPLIVWTVFDADAIYALVMDHRGIEPMDAPIAGPTQIVRIDRTTGRSTSAIVRVWRDTLVDAPGRLLWAQPTTQPDKWTIQQLDKKTMTISTAATLNINYINQMARVGGVLWIRQTPGDLVALSVNELTPVKWEHAGRPPRSLAPYDPKALGNLLGGDATGVWLAADQSRIARLNDDGTMTVRHFGQTISPEFPAYQTVAGDKFLFVFWHGRLLRLSPGSDKVPSLPLGDRNLTHLDTLHAASRIWLRTKYGGDLMSMNLDFADLRIIPPAEKGGWKFLPQVGRGAAAVGEDLFGFVSSVGLARITPAGKATVVESFDQFLKEWFNREFNREATQQDTERYRRGALTTDNGRLMVLNQPKPDRLAIWLYDPATDKWSDSAITTTASPLWGNPPLAASTDGTVSQVTPDGLKAAARVPNWSVLFGGDRRVLLTGRYLYVRTQSGLLRVARP